MWELRKYTLVSGEERRYIRRSKQTVHAQTLEYTPTHSLIVSKPVIRSKTGHCWLVVGTIDRKLYKHSPE